MAFLSDCHSAAILDRAGSVVWWCPPRFDRPSSFGRLLGSDAGHWTMAPAQPSAMRRSYLSGTLVLETRYRTDTGEAKVTDALALELGSRAHEAGRRAPHVLLRVVEGVDEGDVLGRAGQGAGASARRRAGLLHVAAGTTGDPRHRARPRWNGDVGAFTGAFDSDQLDASVLLLPLVRFVPAADPKMRSTIERVERELAADGVVHRWAEEPNGFTLCAFWLSECFSLLGEVEQAETWMKRGNAAANDIGLIAEEVDPGTGRAWGNVPQAFSHAGQISAAWRLTEHERSVSDEGSAPMTGILESTVPDAEPGTGSVAVPGIVRPATVQDTWVRARVEPFTGSPLPLVSDGGVKEPWRQEVETMRPDIQVGATFPDYRLSDHTGSRRSLSELQGDDPMILVLSRGHFCPKDRRQLRNYVDFYPELKVGYTRIVTVSTDNLLETNEFRDGLGAQWPFLSDPGRKVQKDLEIAEYTDPHNDPMIPHTFVLAPGLRIYKVYNGYWYWGRPSVEDLRRDLRELFQEIRPDWDISRSELKEAWERGERERFFPYRKERRELRVS